MKGKMIKELFQALDWMRRMMDKSALNLRPDEEEDGHGTPLNVLGGRCKYIHAEDSGHQ